MDTAGGVKKRLILRLAFTALSLLVPGLCGKAKAAVSDHLLWGQILQSRIYDDPAYVTPLHVFELEL
ncbi:MAG: hypothetical protein ABFE01_21870, partial [Phycisphaerales bacterium]